MIDGSDDVEFEFAVGGCLEDTGVDFDLLDARAVEGAEGGDNAGLFAGRRKGRRSGDVESRGIEPMK